jgi:methylated-DNA-protein-cysteine methyltransferase-like protein
MAQNKDSLFERIYAKVREIPTGKVVTYGEVALALGIKDVRKVGWALNKNPYEGEVPCHRVVNKEGRLAPNFAFDGPEEQRRRLEAEGVEMKDPPPHKATEGHGEIYVDLDKDGWNFS